MGGDNYTDTLKPSRQGEHMYQPHEGGPRTGRVSTNHVKVENEQEKYLPITLRCRTDRKRVSTSSNHAKVEHGQETCLSTSHMKVEHRQEESIYLPLM